MDSPFKHRKDLVRGGFLAGMMALSLIGCPAVYAQNEGFPPQQGGGGYGMEGYNDYSYQAQEAYTQGQLSRAIDLYKKALPMAPEISQSAIYNNLAAVYMKRGNFNISKKNPEGALSDFRNADYYIDYGWPEGLERKAIYERNLKVAKENLAIAYHNMRISPSDEKMHLEMGKKLWSEAKFQEAIVEFAQVHEANPKDKESLRAMGTLFNVLSRPDKSKKYLQKLVALEGGAAGSQELSMLANAQNKTGQVQDAVSTLNKALEANPDNSAALNQLETIWRDEVKFNPSNPTAHANLAWVLQKKKRYEEAMQQYNIADYLANRDPNTSFDVKKMIRMNLGSLFQQVRRFDKALEAYNTILQVEPDNRQALYYKATLLRDMGRHDEAMQAYYRLLSANTNDATSEEARRDLLALIMQNRDPERVTSGLKFYAGKFDNNALIQSQVGEAFHKMKDFPDAVIYYQRAIQLNPKLASAYANLGAALQAEGKTDEALDAFKKAQRLDPKNDTVNKYLASIQQTNESQQFQKAMALQDQGKHVEAIPYFVKALSLDPDNPDVMVAYGVSLQNTGKLPDAIAQYKQAIAKSPSNGSYHFYLATAYHQQQLYDKAKAEYEKTLSLEKDNQDVIRQAREALSGIGQTETQSVLTSAVDAYNQKNYTKALTLVNKAIAASPQDATAYYYKALILSDENRPREAVQDYQLAVKYQPDFKDAYYGLGIALDKEKNPTAAKNAFQKFLDLSKNTPDDDFIKYAKQRVAEH